MSTVGEVVVSADELWSIVTEVWESILGSGVVQADHAFGLDAALTAAVSIHGDWDGLVTFTCPEPAARDIARVMLDLDAEAALSEDDVEDALGEIANVVGGQVKSLCAGENRLGLPDVRRGMVLPRAKPCCRVGVEWAGHVARVAVWRSTATAVGSVDGEAR
jgi:chemotaxis protein CheX